jgi:hypothetical protein
VTIFRKSAVAALALCAGAAQAQMHKCTGADGKITYRDNPCPSGSKTETFGTADQVKRGAPAAPESRPAQRAADEESGGRAEFASSERAAAFGRFLDSKGVPYRSEMTPGGLSAVIWQDASQRDWSKDFAVME